MFNRTGKLFKRILSAILTVILCLSATPAGYADSALGDGSVLRAYETSTVGTGRTYELVLSQSIGVSNVKWDIPSKYVSITEDNGASGCKIKITSDSSADGESVTVKCTYKYEKYNAYKYRYGSYTKGGYDTKTATDAWQLKIVSVGGSSSGKTTPTSADSATISASTSSVAFDLANKSYMDVTITASADLSDSLFIEVEKYPSEKAGFGTVGRTANSITYEFNPTGACKGSVTFKLIYKKDATHNSIIDRVTVKYAITDSRPAVTPAPTPKVTPTPTPEVTPEPVPEVMPEPIPEVTTEPVPEVTPEPIPEVTPEPAPEVTPGPTLTPEVSPNAVSIETGLDSVSLTADGKAILQVDKTEKTSEYSYKVECSSGQIKAEWIDEKHICISGSASGDYSVELQMIDKSTDKVAGSKTIPVHVADSSDYSATFTASDANPVLTAGGQCIVTFSAAGKTPEEFRAIYDNSSTSVNYSWGSWEKHTSVPLYIESDTPGTYTVTIFLWDCSTGEVVAEVPLMVTVQSETAPNETPEPVPSPEIAETPDAAQVTLPTETDEPVGLPISIETPEPTHSSTPVVTPTPTISPSTNAEIKFNPILPTTVYNYTMEVYVTQETKSPYNLMFRDYSIQGNYKKYGASEKYGENHFTVTVTEDQLSKATKYDPNDYISAADKNYAAGFNRSEQIAYVVATPLGASGKYYPLFITGKTSQKSGNWQTYNGSYKMTVGKDMDHTGCNYTVLGETVKNCTGICFQYQVTELWSGTCTGTRYIEVYNEDTKAWELVGTTFEYNKQGEIVTVTAEWDSPKTISAFGTARVKSDSSRFNYNHALLKVRIG